MVQYYTVYLVLIRLSTCSTAAIFREKMHVRQLQISRKTPARQAAAAAAVRNLIIMWTAIYVQFSPVRQLQIRKDATLDPGQKHMVIRLDSCKPSLIRTKYTVPIRATVPVLDLVQYYTALNCVYCTTCHEI